MVFQYTFFCLHKQLTRQLVLVKQPNQSAIKPNHFSKPTQERPLTSSASVHLLLVARSNAGVSSGVVESSKVFLVDCLVPLTGGCRVGFDVLLMLKIRGFNKSVRNVIFAAKANILKIPCCPMFLLVLRGSLLNIPNIIIHHFVVFTVPLCVSSMPETLYV